MRPYVGPATSPELIDLLRTTLEQIEKDEQLKPDDPALLELKRSILRLMGDLREAKSHRAA